MSLRQSDSDPPDFLNRPADQGRREDIADLRSVFLGVEMLVRYWIAAIMAKASMTSETWRCQPCHERVSL